MQVELIKPYDYLDARPCETLNDILNRVEENISNDLPDDFLGDTSKTLLKTATEKLTLSYEEVLKVVDIARVIALIDKDDKIKPEHVAEALGYVPEE